MAIPELKNESATNEAWHRLLGLLEKRFGKKLKTEAILLMIGLQEMNMRAEELGKQEKMDLMHVGTCTILEAGGYYVRTDADEDGWPRWQMQKALPHMDFLEQGALLRYYIVEYFKGVYDELAND